MPKPWRVVVVDDDADIRSLIGAILGHDARFDVVAEAANGDEGIEAIKAHRPDAVVLDLLMRGMDGTTALPIIRELVPDCRVAVCSAYRDGATYLRTEGADAYIDKFDLHRRLADLLAELCQAEPA